MLIASYGLMAFVNQWRRAERECQGEGFLAALAAQQTRLSSRQDSNSSPYLDAKRFSLFTHTFQINHFASNDFFKVLDSPLSFSLPRTFIMYDLGYCLHKHDNKTKTKQNNVYFLFEMSLSHKPEGVFNEQEKIWLNSSFPLLRQQCRLVIVSGL